MLRQLCFDVVSCSGPKMCIDTNVSKKGRETGKQAAGDGFFGLVLHQSNRWLYYCMHLSQRGKCDSYIRFFSMWKSR